MRDFKQKNEENFKKEEINSLKPSDIFKSDVSKLSSSFNPTDFNNLLNSFDKNSMLLSSLGFSKMMPQMNVAFPSNVCHIIYYILAKCPKQISKFKPKRYGLPQAI